MGLFEGISFYIAEKAVRDASELKNILVKGGGQREFYPSDLVSHVISDSLPSPSLGLARCTTSIMIHSDWVYMSSRCGVLLPTTPFTLSRDKLFSGLVFCPSKLPRSDVEKLACLAFYYGGTLQRRLDETVTHLITMETSGKKYECAVCHGVKVVTPDWLIDGINMGSLPEVDDYQLRGRGRGHHTHSVQKQVTRCNGDGHNWTNEAVGEPQETTEDHNQTTEDHNQTTDDNTVTKTEAPGQDDIVMEEYPESQETATTGDSTVPLWYEKGTTVVTAEHREGTFTAVEQERITVLGGGEGGDGEGGGEGDDEMEIMSGEGELVDAKNPEVTPDPTPGASGDMVQSAAAGTGVASCGGGSGGHLLAGMVFHLTGYLECIEEDTLCKWKEVILQHGGSVVDSYDSARCTHLLALHKKSDTFAKAYADGKCISSAHWLNDVLTDGKIFPPRCALHFPTAFKWQIPGADRYSMTLTNYSGSERELVRDMIHLTGIPYTGHLSRDTTYLICKSASGKKYEKAVEWGVTIVNASFLADIIHNGQIPAVLYSRHTHLGLPHELLPSHCFEASRLLRPWESFLQSYSGGCVDRDATELVFRSVRGRGRVSEGSEEGGGKAKRRRVEERKSPPVVMMTGISQSIVKKLRLVIQELGGIVTDKPRECTHLVAPRVARTVKFLSGISVCSYVLTPEWVEQCEREGQLINEEGFTLQDTDAEETFSMDIPTTLSRAKRGRLLEGHCIHATANVQPSHDSLREIIECAGGKLVGSGEAQSLFGRKFEKMDRVKLLVLSTLEDLASGLCALFTSHNIPIYNTEVVLTGVLKQQLDLSQNLLPVGTRPAGTTSGPSYNEE